jgi:hypothetical protein
MADDTVAVRNFLKSACSHNPLDEQLMVQAPMGSCEVGVIYGAERSCGATIDEAVFRHCVM